MTERLAHDHPTVDTVSAAVGRDGPTKRPIVEIDTGLSVDPETVVRLVLDGTEYRALIENSGASRKLRHAAATPRLARNPSESENALREWLEARDLPVGRTVHLDVVEPGFRYGLRAPGESAVYRSGRPDDSLSAIARDLDADSNRSH
jgi:hypothetical protein